MLFAPCSVLHLRIPDRINEIIYVLEDNHADVIAGEGGAENAMG
jgi:hypothetical protein